MDTGFEPASTNFRRDDADLGTSLTPLPPVLRRGLTAVAAFGYLSAVSTASLFSYLAYRFVRRQYKSNTTRLNQFVALIFNLVLADIHQAIGFVLCTQWLLEDGIFSRTPTCWAQGWFISAGDLGSGIFTIAIAVHGFADIVFDWRPGHITFLVILIGCWVLNYSISASGIAMHQEDYYVRAGPWCWINERYQKERLWLHYFWIITIEFCTVLIYLVLFVILRRRIRNRFYASEGIQHRAASAMKTIVVYPIIYVVCTLPAVVVRLHIMSGGTVTFPQFCVIGVMMGSNGWLDVLLYSITRSSLIFGPDVEADDMRALDTYTTWSTFQGDFSLGNTTTIESRSRSPGAGAIKLGSLSHIRRGSKDTQSSQPGEVKRETTFDVRTEQMPAGWSSNFVVTPIAEETPNWDAMDDMVLMSDRRSTNPSAGLKTVESTKSDADPREQSVSDDILRTTSAKSLDNGEPMRPHTAFEAQASSESIQVIYDPDWTYFPDVRAIESASRK